jgi:hypothetical protein
MTNDKNTGRGVPRPYDLSFGGDEKGRTEARPYKPFLPRLRGCVGATHWVVPQ